MEGNYRARFRPVQSLSLKERASMSRLYMKYYENADEAAFQRDLDAKTEVEMLHWGGELVGFSALLLYEAEWQGQVVRIAYSGDTIVHRDHWGQQALPAAWLRRAASIHGSAPEVPFYWFLLVKGHRTYRFMPLFTEHYHPAPGNDGGNLKGLADKLAGDKFGGDYNTKSGVVEFPRSQGNLREEVAHPTERERRNPAVRFFLERNPGYLRGHELVCLCRIASENLRPFARRIFERGAV